MKHNVIKKIALTGLLGIGIASQTLAGGWMWPQFFTKRHRESSYQFNTSLPTGQNLPQAKFYESFNITPALGVAFGITTMGMIALYFKASGKAFHKPKTSPQEIADFNKKNALWNDMRREITRTGTCNITIYLASREQSDKELYSKNESWFKNKIAQEIALRPDKMQLLKDVITYGHNNPYNSNDTVDMALRESRVSNKNELIKNDPTFFGLGLSIAQCKAKSRLDEPLKAHAAFLGDYPELHEFFDAPHLENLRKIIQSARSIANTEEFNIDKFLRNYDLQSCGNNAALYAKYKAWFFDERRPDEAERNAMQALINNLQKNKSTTSLLVEALQLSNKALGRLSLCIKNEIPSLQTLIETRLTMLQDICSGEARSSVQQAVAQNPDKQKNISDLSIECINQIDEIVQILKDKGSFNLILQPTNRQQQTIV